MLAKKKLGRRLKMLFVYKKQKYLHIEDKKLYSKRLYKIFKNKEDLDIFFATYKQPVFYNKKIIRKKDIINLKNKFNAITTNN